MRAHGFQGTILPVNPNRAEVQGIKAYPSVADLPETPDVAIVAVPANLAFQAIDDLGRRGTKGAIVFTAGFAEVDEAGEREQDRMLAAARGHGMRVLGPNCLGAFDGRTGYYATFTASLDSGLPIPGRIAIASQSGAYGTHVFTIARNRGIGASLCVMTGNEGDVTVGDVIGWMAEHPDTDVIAAYVEGVREADSFPRGARGGSRGEEADRADEGRPQRARHGGREVAHRLDRRRRRRDRGGAQRVRRGPRAHHRGNA